MLALQHSSGTDLTAHTGWDRRQWLQWATTTLTKGTQRRVTKTSTHLFPGSGRQPAPLYFTTNLMARRCLAIKYMPNLYKRMWCSAIKLTYVLQMWNCSLVQESSVKQREWILSSPVLCRNKEAHSSGLQRGLSFPWHLQVILINGSVSLIWAQRGNQPHVDITLQLLEELTTNCYLSVPSTPS